MISHSGRTSTCSNYLNSIYSAVQMLLLNVSADPGHKGAVSARCMATHSKGSLEHFSV